jgi:phosphoglycolate phosphatase
MNSTSSPASTSACALAFDLIVFDWDGTLFDSTANIVRSLQEACADLGLRRPTHQEAAYVIGLGLGEAMRHLAPKLTEAVYSDLVQRYSHHYRSLQDALTLFPGAVEMLQALKTRGHALAVATGKTRVGLDQALAHVELKNMFDATRTADETFSKPHPRMLQELIETLGVTPKRTLMIGDTTHDLQLARNAGTPSVAVSYGAHEPSVFHEFTPRFIAHSVAELEQWLLESSTFSLTNSLG